MCCDVFSTYIIKVLLVSRLVVALCLHDDDDDVKMKCMQLEKNVQLHRCSAWRGSVDLCLFPAPCQVTWTQSSCLSIKSPSSFPSAYYWISIKDDVALTQANKYLPPSSSPLHFTPKWCDDVEETRSLCWCLCFDLLSVFFVFFSTPCRIVVPHSHHASNDEDKDHGAQSSSHVRPVWRIFHRRHYHHRMSTLMWVHTTGNDVSVSTAYMFTD